jgi:Cdc6-like AAA superfamily ATPase
VNDRHPDQHLIDRLARLSEVFRPSGPITTRELFFGRIRQLTAVGRLVETAGQHGVIFGERGVGKTSLAAVSLHIFGGRLGMRINCDSGDTFASLWEKVIEELILLTKSRREPVDDTTKSIIEDTVELLHFDAIGPDRVRHALRLLAEVAPVLIYFDEFDRIADARCHALLADTIKTLSDQLVNATLVIVGVADDVDTLISNHRSIERALAQVPMPRMDVDEVEEIIEKGFAELDLKATPGALYRLARLPQGLPHFAHLLAREAASEAIYLSRDEVTEENVRTAIRASIEHADESMTRAYVEATASSHQTLYENVLLACAMARVDDLGYFTPGDLRGPLKRITGETYDIPRYARHLVQFCNERGPVLERAGGERKWRYRFINPEMRPHIVMRAVASGVSEDILDIAPGPEPSEQLF